MKIIKIPVGYLEANCYILNKNNENLIIDPGDEFEKIQKQINGKVLGILITHHHFDHIGALKQLKEKFNCPIYEYPIKEGIYSISNFIFEIISTKGHTSDSITFYFEQERIMFTGDFLFKETVGRTDLETGNMFEMIESLKKISKYDATIYPGHGDITTLEYEKKHNPYLIKYN